MTKINCHYARFITWDGSDPVYECTNSEAKNRYKSASDKVCAACKDRTPVSKNHPPVIETQKEVRQITLKEYMDATA